MDNKEQINWCVKMIEKATADYNIEDIKNYTAMLKVWLNK